MICKKNLAKSNNKKRLRKIRSNVLKNNQTGNFESLFVIMRKTYLSTPIKKTTKKTRKK